MVITKHDSNRPYRPTYCFSIRTILPQHPLRLNSTLQLPLSSPFCPSKLPTHPHSNHHFQRPRRYRCRHHCHGHRRHYFLPLFPPIFRQISATFSATFSTYFSTDFCHFFHHFSTPYFSTSFPKNQQKRLKKGEKTSKIQKQKNQFFTCDLTL